MPADRWQLGRCALDCTRPRLMAIVNATPDSFFAGSRLTESSTEREDALGRILAEQPDILDIGGQSTRPGSPRIPAAEELTRVLPVVAAARRFAPGLPITVDTYNAAVAREALAAGADGVNDISGGRLDPALWDVLAQAQCGYVLMHMQGRPETMQQAPAYADAVVEVGGWLREQLAALEDRGIASERVVLDPGIGFGKRLEDNLALIARAGELTELGRPLLYGVSRKSFIGKLDAAASDAAERLPGSLAATLALLERGVMLHRVHDVAATRQAIAVWQALRQVE